MQASVNAFSYKNLYCLIPVKIYQVLQYLKDNNINGFKVKHASKISKKRCTYSLCPLEASGACIAD